MSPANTPQRNGIKEILKRFFSHKLTRVFLILLLDIGFAVTAFVIAYAIRFNARGVSWLEPDYYQHYDIARFVLNRVWIAAIFVGITVGLLAAFDNYNSVWRYAGRVEFFKIIVAYFVTAAAIFVFSIIMRITPAGILVPSEVILLFLFFSVIFTLGIRYQSSIRSQIAHLSKRAYSTVSGAKAYKGNLNTIVIGAGYSGSQFVDSSLANPSDGYQPMLFLDEDKTKHGTKVHGIPVVGGLDKLAAAVKRFRIEAIVIAIVNAPKAKIKELYTECAKYGVPVKVMSKLTDADKSAGFAALELRDIKVEELLGGDEFRVNANLLEKSIKDKVVLVTGGAGSIGSELCRQALMFGCRKLIIFDMHENGMFILNQEFKDKFSADDYTLVVGSVRDKARLAQVFKKHKPQVVFHAAAYKHVPMMEFSSTEALKNNVFGTQNVIDVAESSGAEKFVFISTDKAVNPANIMGATKRIAEMVVETRGKKSKMRMAAVRFGNVLGSNGSVIPIFLEQIKSGGPITITHKDIERYFMTIPEAVRLVLQAGALARTGDVFVLDMGEPVKIYDLACDLVKINGLVPGDDIEINEVGLRPGEKMFEELCYSKETVDTTVHEGIFATKMQKIDPKKFKLQLDALKKATEKELVDECAEKIFEIVPSIYRDNLPQNLKTKIEAVNASQVENNDILDDNNIAKMPVSFEELEQTA